MYYRDYAKEIDMHADVKIVPLKLALPVLGAVVGGAWFSLALTQTPRASDKIAATTVSASETVASR